MNYQNASGAAGIQEPELCGYIYRRPKPAVDVACHVRSFPLLSYYVVTWEGRRARPPAKNERRGSFGRLVTNSHMTSPRAMYFDKKN
jgi:hypothetical protein